MQELKSNYASVDLAAQWILSSGIQSSDGGFHAWYDLPKKYHAFIYSEITGYAITTLLFLRKIYKEDIFLENAKKAARWIKDCALSLEGGVRTRLYTDNEKADKTYSFCGENIFSFDLGMVLYAMVNMFKITYDEAFLEVSVSMADFLLQYMQKKDGSLAPIYNAAKKKHIESFDKWSNQSGSFHAKVCLGLVDLFGITKEKKYRDTALKICEYALTKQEKSGRFVTDKINRSTNLHPHCYAAEGLMYVGAYLGEKKFIEAAQRATQWIFENIQEGMIDEFYDPLNGKFNNFQRSDVLAQSLRLGVIFLMENKTIEQLKAFLLQHQYVGQDQLQHGGVLYNKGSQHLNSWCTMFALQALAFCQDKNLIPSSKKIDLFI